MWKRTGKLPGIESRSLAWATSALIAKLRPPITTSSPYCWLLSGTIHYEQWISKQYPTWYGNDLYYCNSGLKTSTRKWEEYVKDVLVWRRFYEVTYCLVHEPDWAYEWHVSILKFKIDFIKINFRKIFCGAGEVPIPANQRQSRPFRKLLWLPIATRWGSWQPKCSRVYEKHSNSSYHELFIDPQGETAVEVRVKAQA